MQGLFQTDYNSLTRSEVYDRVEDTIHEAFAQENPTLVEALPAMGKSASTVKWAAQTDNHLTVFTSRGELYGQYEDWCIDHGLTYQHLPAFHSECGTIDDDDESSEKEAIEAEVLEVYESGISGAQLHLNARKYFGQPLPCQQHGSCPYMEQRDFDPSSYDVLIGHYLQAHNQSYIEDRYVAFDEFPGDAYFFEPTHNEATNAVSNYLQAEDDLPFDSWKDLIHRRHKPQYQDEVGEWKDDIGFYSHRDTRYVLQSKPGFHAHAPLLTHAGLEFELLDNDWEYAELGSGRIAVRSPEDEWTVLMPPSLYAAESVVALDGTPSVTKWRLALGGHWIEHEEVLETDSKKQEYLNDVLGLELVQTKAGSKPYQSGRHLNLKSDGALLEGIREREGEKPAVITSKQARDQYKESGVIEHIEEAEHYGNLKGSNKFEDTRLGVIIGSPHPPEDEAVERWAAFEGESVQRKQGDDDAPSKGVDLDFGAFGNSLFRDVVESEVLQAAMRFGRSEGEVEKGATVYVHTSRLPRWVEPKERIEVGTWSNGMREVVEAIRDSEKWPDGEWQNKELAEQTSITAKQVCELLKELDEAGYVSHRRGGRGNAYHWSNERLEEFTEYGRLN